MCGVKAAYDCIKAFSETDFTEDLKKIDVPTLVMHGDDDQVVPIGASAMLSSKLVRSAAAQGVQGPAARDGNDAPRRDQRGPPGLLQGVGAAAGAARGEPLVPATIALGG